MIEDNIQALINEFNKALCMDDAVRASEQGIDDGLKAIRSFTEEVNCDLLLEYYENADTKVLKPYIVKFSKYNMIHDALRLNIFGKCIRFASWHTIRHMRLLCCSLRPSLKSMPENFFKGKPYEYLYLGDFSRHTVWIKDIYSNFEEYEALVHSLEDIKSKVVLLFTLMARLTPDLTYYSRSKDIRHAQYFDTDILPVLKNVVFVDGGGFTGDTAKAYNQIFGQETLSAYYLYEPNMSNMEEAKKTLAGYNNIIFRESGLSDVVGEIRFKNDADSSCIDSESGDVIIQTTTIDTDINRIVTFIKMDVEGAEMAGLHGAEQHIRNEKPVMTICLYHNPEDIREICAYVKELRPDYKLYIRHYSQNCLETILYAI